MRTRDSHYIMKRTVHPHYSRSQSTLYKSCRIDEMLLSYLLLHVVNKSFQELCAPRGWKVTTRRLKTLSLLVKLPTPLSPARVRSCSVIDNHHQRTRQRTHSQHHDAGLDAVQHDMHLGGGRCLHSHSNTPHPRCTGSAARTGPPSACTWGISLSDAPEFHSRSTPPRRDRAARARRRTARRSCTWCP